MSGTDVVRLRTATPSGTATLRYCFGPPQSLCDVRAPRRAMTVACACCGASRLSRELELWREPESRRARPTGQPANQCVRATPDSPDRRQTSGAEEATRRGEPACLLCCPATTRHPSRTQRPPASARTASRAHPHGTCPGERTTYQISAGHCIGRAEAEHADFVAPKARLCRQTGNQTWAIFEPFWRGRKPHTTPSVSGLPTAATSSSLSPPANYAHQLFLWKHFKVEDGSERNREGRRARGYLVSNPVPASWRTA
eukprot:1666484-Rhodomonas_salina.3